MIGRLGCMFSDGEMRDVVFVFGEFAFVRVDRADRGRKILFNDEVC